MNALKAVLLALSLAATVMISQARAESAGYRAGERDIAYTLAIPAGGAKGAPVVIVAHGLSGVAFYAPLFERWSRALAGAGFVVLMPHYFDPKVDTADPPEIDSVRFKAWRDVLTAGIGEARRIAGGTAEVGIVGFSLGGYLATAVAARDASVRAMVVQGSGLSSNIAEQPHRMPATLLIHATRDPTTPITEAGKLDAWLRAHGGTTKWLVIDRAEHIVEHEADAIAMAATLAFLARHLRSDVTDKVPQKAD